MELDILLTGFLSKLPPEQRHLSKEHQYDEIILHLREELLTCSKVVTHNDQLLTGLSRFIPAENELPMLRDTWQGWTLRADPLLNDQLSDPVMTDAAGKAIMVNGIVTDDLEDGERPIPQERCILAMADIPGFGMRIQACKDVLELERKLSDVAHKVQVIQEALWAIEQSEDLVEMMMVILAVGNLVNAKKPGRSYVVPPKPGARMLESSDKTALLDVFSLLRANDLKSNLLQWVVRILSNASSVVDPFDNLVKPLSRAAEIDPIMMERTFIDLKSGLTNLRSVSEEVLQCPPLIGNPGMLDRFHSYLQSSLERLDIKLLEQNFQAMQESFMLVAQNFCFDPLHFDFQKTPMEEFFRSILKMSITWQEACRMVHQQDRLAQLQKQRSEARQQKLISSPASSHTGQGRTGLRHVQNSDRTVRMSDLVAIGKKEGVHFLSDR